MNPRLPNITHRTTVIGRTGSGKTVAGAWHLSNQPIEIMPWILFDFKTDKLINKIENAEHIDYSFVPKKAGVYIIHPLPEDRGNEKLEKYLWKLWSKGFVGIYVDEGFMMGNDNEAFEAILTQGRSLEIPVITCTQRPVWLTRFAFSEVDFYQLFHLNDERDFETVQAFMPVQDVILPRYHSYYYDVGDNKLWKFLPVPPEDVTLRKIDERTRPKKSLHLL